MSIRAKVIADSISPAGARITTFELKYPRRIHDELMTHRAFSRNASSSRAIPLEKMKRWVTEDPYIPIHWGKNQKGMQATEELSEDAIAHATIDWLAARDQAVAFADSIASLGVHKQIVNGLLAPWAHIIVVCTATDFSNWFALRMHRDAIPEIQCLAVRMARALAASAPEAVPCGNWHMPYTTAAEQLSLDGPTLRKISAARCARTSFRTHDGRESVVAEDVALYERLVGEDPKHSSPTEHQAMASFWAGYRSGNFIGWEQARQKIAGNAAPPDFDWMARLEAYGDHDYIV